MTDWDSYRCFLMVAREGSLSAAARRLNISQPTIGRRIHALEQSLQARLFVRENHGYRLTPAGERILELIENMERDALAVERRVGGDDKSLAGEVCLCTTEGIATYWLAPKLPKLKECLPEIEIEIVVGIHMLDLLRREADLALRIGNPGSEELVGRRLGQVHCGLFASKAYLAKHGRPKSLEDLAQHSLVESTREIAGLAQVRLLRDVAPRASTALRCNSVTTQMAAARAGLAILALPLYMAQGAPKLQRILTKSFAPELDIWLLTHRDLKQTARIRAVIDFLAKEIKRDMPRLTGREKI